VRQTRDARSVVEPVHAWQAPPLQALAASAVRRLELLARQVQERSSVDTAAKAEDRPPWQGLIGDAQALVDAEDPPLCRRHASTGACGHAAKGEELAKSERKAPAAREPSLALAYAPLREDADTHVGVVGWGGARLEPGDALGTLAGGAAVADGVGIIEVAKLGAAAR
jgi:hypothetical protein